MFEECHVQNYLCSSEMYFHFELIFLHNFAHLTESISDLRNDKSV